MAETIEEAVWDITGTPDVERVIVQDEVKLYRARAILAYLDSPYHDYSDAVIAIENPLPVINDMGQLIGHAHAELVGNRIVAEVAIEYSSPERLVAETRQGVRHYPRIVGVEHCKLVGQPFIDTHGDKTYIVALTIEGITLSERASTDKRLYPLGEPVL